MERAAEAVADIAHALIAASRTLGDDSDPSLAQGSAGMALFLAYYSLANTSAEAAQAADLCLDHAFAAMSSTAMHPGLHVGFTGIAWVARHLSNVGALQQTFDLTEIEDAALQVVTSIPETIGIDTISGLAGCGTFLGASTSDIVAREGCRRTVAALGAMATAQRTGVTWHRTAHTKIASWRGVFPEGVYDVGAAHGQAGVISFLSHVRARSGPSPELDALLRSSVEWVVDHRTTSAGDVFPAMVPLNQPVHKVNRLAWCYGDPGVAIALLHAGIATGDSEWSTIARDVLLNCDRRSHAETNGTDPTFCHGNAGLAQISHRAHVLTGDSTHRNARHRWIEAMLASRQRDGVGGFAYPDEEGRHSYFGLLDGASGIGLVLLGAIDARAAAWDQAVLLSGFL